MFVFLSTHRLRFTLNGSPQSLEVRADRRLIDVLRDDVGATGTKEGCSIGVCGSCSVLVGGELFSACLLPAVFVDGRDVMTVEGLADGDKLSSLQDSFIREGGFQCGICTPGQLIAATALLAENSRPSDDEIREWMMGNLCRCTGYYGITRAIKAAVA
ncbi:MAG TPA: (2Fe-2S)-binding protein [Candidatus Limnocylindria bacterium]|nr:(2Fe-2S)-binding protein [Candidatus Limnocylindria bacterium]